MRFVEFMRSMAGRLLRIVAGLALILLGLLVVKGTAGIVIGIVGIVPLAAGVFNFCLIGPLVGVGFFGNRPR
ncbi:MAG: DUF2892 domain-containing protein [Mycobacterium sp.]|uniref:YgaP-like transmembrane domain n=1 Tax=Mycobacterium sp. TaxID=1785 RepID=UPI00263A130C|nr:YgaP-like transmembrane domain [Mycobacterium sp.]MDI3314169.1 DUF2892 domain-containing protein [Mycobacterium sp.]